VVTGHRGSQDPRLRELLRQVHQHPGYAEYLQINALSQTLWRVFAPNTIELLALLNKVSTDWPLALELAQNTYRPDVRDAFETEMLQRLHNYLGSSSTVIDHSRRIMRDRLGTVANEFARRKIEMLRNPEPHFVQGLRNYTTHRILPSLGHTMTIKDVNTEKQTMVSEVEMNVAQLLEWDNWSPTAREFLKNHGKVVPLRPIFIRHSNLMFDLNGWLLLTLTDANRDALDEVNQLVIQLNATMLGVTFEDAKRYTDLWTQMRSTPRPP
jgi:hypothetical protein